MIRTLKRVFAAFLRLVLALTGLPAVLFGVRLFWGGLEILRESGDKTAGAVFIAAGIALSAAGVFFLRRALQMKS